MSLTKNPPEVLDVEGCIKDELTPHAGTRYRFKVGNERLEFRDQEVGDPVPTGRQVLQAAGIRSVVDHLLFVMLENGTFAGVRLDELVDLIQRRVKWFVVFKGDRSYRFMLDDRRIEWGAVTISGHALRVLAGVAPAYGVWIERRGQPDRFLAAEDSVSLDAEIIERFRTGPIFTLCIEDQSHIWPDSTITTEEIAALGGWNPAEGVIEVDGNQNERQLTPGESVTLKSGVSFGKMIRWRRG